MKKHEITKVRRESVRRKLRVATTEYVTPKMLRIVFQSDELQGFDSPSPDDHIKVFFPLPPNEQGEPQRAGRDFTPRAWNLAAGTLTIEFALHASGPASDWARAAQPGNTLEMGGPRGSTVVPDDFDWYLLVGDASALPSFGRRLEGLRPGIPAHVFSLVAGAAEQQTFATRANCQVRWLTAGNSAAADISTLRAALGQFELPAGDGFIWIAAESSVSREIYRYLTDERSQPTEWVKAAGYWTESPQ